MTTTSQLNLHPSVRVASGYAWTECPRWHNGTFYFADLYVGRIVAIGDDGVARDYADFRQRERLEGTRPFTGGFGFLPDGRLIVNSMEERLVLVWDEGKIDVYADLRPFANAPINDMVVDNDGRAYITQMGFNVWTGEAHKTAPLLCVEPDGTVRELTGGGELLGANGIAISADGLTVVTAEAPAKRLTAFDRDPLTGDLSAPRLFAQLELLPDGICMDEEGAVWAAQPGAGGAIRVREGGAITDKVWVDTAVAGRSAACMLGGDDRRTLYVCCGFDSLDQEKSIREGKGSVWAGPVPVSAGSARP